MYNELNVYGLYLMTKISPSETKVLLNHLDWNLQRLEEVLKEEKTEYFKGAALQRFGHTYEIALKIISSFAQSKSIFCKSEEQYFEIAVQKGWIKNQPKWTEIIADYQKINQKPKHDIENIYSKLVIYHKAFHYLFAQLKDLIKH